MEWSVIVKRENSFHGMVYNRYEGEFTPWNGLLSLRGIIHSMEWSINSKRENSLHGKPIKEKCDETKQRRSWYGKYHPYLKFIFNKISSLCHLFFLILTCSCPFSYNLMLTAPCKCRPYM
jgi:hypothetical protein